MNCVCFATIRPLLNMSHVILQHFTTIAQLISFKLSLIIPCKCIIVLEECCLICNYFGNSYNLNQNLLVAQIFCRFWSCANCESHFRKHPCYPGINNTKYMYVHEKNLYKQPWSIKKLLVTSKISFCYKLLKRVKYCQPPPPEN